MELPESSRRIDGDRATGSSGERASSPRFQPPRSVVVAVDATRELQLAALQYALENIVSPGDNLYLLGIVHQVLNLLGFKQKANITKFTGTKKKRLDEEIFNKNAHFQKIISDKRIQDLFSLRQVIPEVKIAVGPERKVVTAKEAAELRATWVILDEQLEQDKAYLMEQLNCNIVLMKPKNEAVVLKVGLPLPYDVAWQDDLSIELSPADIYDSRHSRVWNILAKLPKQSNTEAGSKVVC